MDPRRALSVLLARYQDAVDDPGAWLGDVDGVPARIVPPDRHRERGLVRGLTIVVTTGGPGRVAPALVRPGITGAWQGFDTLVATWVLDATTTCVNGNRHDPAIPAFTVGTAADAATDDPARIVSGTVDLVDGRRSAPGILHAIAITRPRPDRFLKFLEALQSPFALARWRFGAEQARLAAACGATHVTVRDWLERRVPVMTVPHPRAFYHVLPYNPSLATVLAVTPAALSGEDRARLAAPFVSWQANTFHLPAGGPDGIFWQFRVPAGHEHDVPDHVEAIVPRARCGMPVVHELSHRHFSFLPWFDFAAGAHVDVSAVVDRLTTSALAVLDGAATVAEHQVLLRATERRRVLGART